MDSQITALQAQMDLLAGGSKEWQTLNTQMQELITQRDAMQVSIAEFDQNEALLLQNEAAYEEGKKALDAKWAELAALKKHTTAAWQTTRQVCRHMKTTCQN